MKLCVAQTRPIVGAVELNIERHLYHAELAAACGAHLIVFPELSLTGYEPRLAAELSRSASNTCFDVFQSISDLRQISIGVGAPLRTEAGVEIGTLIFRPNKPRQSYSKMYLHADEQPYFVPGHSANNLIAENPVVALAICYELSVPQHLEHAVGKGAQVYMASVAKTASGMQQAQTRLAHIARENRMPVLLSNCVGRMDNCECTGRSSAWDSNGALAAQLDDCHEGLIVFDTITHECTVHIADNPCV